MRFEGMLVPGGNWVEIVKVTNKNGSPLEKSNWRHKLFGRVTLCWIAGGFQKRGAFFKGKISMSEGKVVEIDLDSERWCSTTTAHPIEVEPGVYDFETSTSIYRFRLLNDEEIEVIEKVLWEQFDTRLAILANPALSAKELLFDADP